MQFFGVIAHYLDKHKAMCYTTPVARKKKEQKKEDVKFAKFLPGEAKWQGRRGKTYQDRLPIGDRDRVHAADRVRNYSMKHKPRNSADWNGLR